jgi:uncharacterized membrane protein YkvA (DUF1232 family)
VRIRDAAKRAMIEARILLRALRDAHTPVSARLIAFGVVIYVIMPFDLIPDYIPVVGLLDDLLVAAIGLAVILRLIPRAVMDEIRPPPPANDNGETAPATPLASLLLALIAVLSLTLVAWWGYGFLAGLLAGPPAP